MNNKGITRENLLRLMPPSLTKDPSIMALASAVAEALEARLEEIDRVRIISNIDSLDEDVLDALAYDFKVDWWDPEYSIEEKRRTLKGSWRVHKTLGTKAAVETAIRAIYPMTQVEEWFEYGGEPYHFRLNINITSDSGDKERQRRVLDRLNYYKSLRSHNDGVRYFLMPEKAWAAAGGGFIGSRGAERVEIHLPEQVSQRPGGKVILGAGGAMIGSRSRSRVSIAVPGLEWQGGKTVLNAGGKFTGSLRRMETAISLPEPVKPGGKAEAYIGAGLVGSYQRYEVKISLKNYEGGQ